VTQDSDDKGGGGGGREVLLEFTRIGKALKVTAVDVASGVEVSIVGDPSVGETGLRRLATRKLDYVLRRRAAPSGPGSKTPPGGGRIA
jgi:hypothetical protein